MAQTGASFLSLPCDIQLEERLRTMRNGGVKSPPNFWKPKKWAIGGSHQKQMVGPNYCMYHFSVLNELTKKTASSESRV
jgi:hypothetical protein